MAEISATMVKELREKTGAGMMDCKRALEQTDGDIARAIDFLREKGLAAAAKKAGRIAAEGIVVGFTEGGLGALVEVNSETDFVARNEDFRAFGRTVAALVARENPADVAALLAVPYPDGGTVADAQKALIARIGENQAVRRFVRYQGDVVHKYIHGGSEAGRVGVLVELAGASGEAALELAHELCLQIASMRPQYVRREDVPPDVLAHEREIERAKALQEGKPADKVDQIVEGRIRKAFFEGQVLLEQLWVKDDKRKIADVIKEYGKKAGADLRVVQFARFEVGEGMEKRDDDFGGEVRKLAGG